MFDIISAMGSHNGPPSWAEMQRVLEGRPPVGDGGDSPAGPANVPPIGPPAAERRRSQVPYAEIARPRPTASSTVRAPGGARRGGGPAGPDGHRLTDHDGLYGVVRFAEAARELDMATVFGAELSLSGVARTEEADPPGPHLLVLARGPGGYRRLSRQLAAAHLAGGQKGVLQYDYDALTDAAGGHWHILTGCRKAPCPPSSSAGGPAAGAALADLVDRFGADRVSVELTGHGHPLDDERNTVAGRLAPRFGVGVVATTAHFAAPSPGRLAMAMSAIRARQSLDEAAGRLAPLGGAHLRSGRRWPGSSPTVPKPSPRQPNWRSSARSPAADRPQLPPYDVPARRTEDSWLRGW